MQGKGLFGGFYRFGQILDLCFNFQLLETGLVHNHVSKKGPMSS